MPGFNTLAPRVSPFGQPLEFYGHPKAYARQRAGDRYARAGATAGQAIGSAIGGAYMGADYLYRNWNYPSARMDLRPRTHSRTMVQTKKKYNKKKVCCIYRKNKRYCSPEYCEKRRRKFYYV